MITTRLARSLSTALLLLGFVSPAAQAQPRTMRVPSAALGETRIVHVQLPPDYAIAKQRYPVVILLDGQVRAFFDLTVATTNYNLTGDGHPYAMPPHIVVGVEQGDRGADLVQHAEAFRRFLTDELLPRIDKEYRTLPFRTLIGHSLGGRFALEAMCRAPGAFPAVIAISPSLPDSLQQEVARCVTGDRAPHALRHLVISGGSLETRTMGNTERLLTALTAGATADWRIHRVDATDLGHTHTPLVTIPLGLRFVFDVVAWDLPFTTRDSLARQLGDPEQVLAHGVADLSLRLGFPAPTPATGLIAATRAWLARRDGARATAAAERLVAQYPEFVLSHTLLADARELAGDPAGTRKAISAALDVSNRIAWFDETQKAQLQAQLKRALAERVPQ